MFWDVVREITSCLLFNIIFLTTIFPHHKPICKYYFDRNLHFLSQPHTFTISSISSLLISHAPYAWFFIFFLDNFTWIYLPFNSPLFLRDGMQNNNFNFIRSVMYMCIKKEKKQRFKIILANTSFHIKSWKTTELQTNCAQIELAWMSRDM